VEGPERLLKRAKTECAVMQQLHDGRMERTPHRVQGVLNNLNGLRAEYGIVRSLVLKPCALKSTNGVRRMRKSTLSVRLAARPAPSSGEHRAGGRVHTPTHGAPPAAPRQLHLLTYVGLPRMDES